MSTSKRAIIAPPQKNRRRGRNLLYASLTLLVVVLIVAVSLASRVPKNASTAPTTANLHVGDAAPEFAVSSTAGPFDLEKTAAGKPVLVEIFATWCPHCQHETTVLDALYNQYGTKLPMIAVSGSQYGIDGSSPESQNDVIGFQQQFHVVYPLAEDDSLDVAHKYLMGGFPTIVVLDKNHKVAYVNSGEIAQPELDKAVRAVL